MSDTLPVNPVIYSRQRADDHSNNVTFCELCTLRARKLASMRFVDSAQRHCDERVRPRSS